MMLNLSISGYFFSLIDFIFDSTKYNALNYFIVYYSLFFSCLACFSIYKIHSFKIYIRNFYKIYKKIIFNLLVSLTLIYIVFFVIFYNKISILFSIYLKNQLFAETDIYYFINQYFSISEQNSFNLGFSTICTILFFAIYLLMILLDKEDFFQQKSFILVFFLCFPIISVKNNELRYMEEPYTRSIIIAPLGYALFSTSIACIEDYKINKDYHKSLYNERFSRRKIIGQNPEFITYYTFFQILSVLILLPSLLISKEEKNA